LKNTWTLSRNSNSFKENVFVRIDKDEITGYGEAAPNVRYGETPELTEKAIHQASKTILDQDLSNHSQVKQVLDELIVDQNCARAARDIALMDWNSKKRNLPFYKILGSNPDNTPLTSYTIGIDEPDMIKTKVSAAAEYPILKIKLGGQNDEDIINAVRSVTDKPLRIDANEGWTDKETAVNKVKWLESKGIEFIEQPMPAKMLEETAWLKQRVDIPIIADEAVINTADIETVAKVYDGINIKLMKSGGMQEALKMIHAARNAGLKIMIGCMIETSIAITAAAHLSPLVDWADLDGNLLITNDPFTGVKVNQGHLILNDNPGIGITGDW